MRMDPVDRGPRMRTWAMPLHQRPVVLAGGGGGQEGPVDPSRPPTRWTLHVFDHDGRLRIEGVDQRIRPGSAGILPSRLLPGHRQPGLSSPVCVDLELPVRGPLVPVPALVELGDRHRAFRSRLEMVLREAAVMPLRSAVRLWDLLWELARCADAAIPCETGDIRLGTAMELIEQGLADDLSVAALAGRVGLSHNHLTRLFRSRLGSTVVGYIRRRRVERAVRLLADSTLPLRRIAGRVGVRDPQMFNKMIRAVTGFPPSHFRSRQPAMVRKHHGGEWPGWTAQAPETIIHQ